MSQFKFTNQRGISTVYSYLLKRLQMLNTFMIYRHTYIHILYIAFSFSWRREHFATYQSEKRGSRQQQQHVKQVAWKMSKNYKRQRLQLKGERAREVREKRERRRAYCFELLKKSHDSSPRHPKVAQANKQTERESWETSHKLTDLGEEKESGKRKNGRKNYFISIKFNEKLHTAIAEG